MERFFCKIIVKPLDEIKDSQGKALENILKQIGVDQNPIVKAGKYYELILNADNSESANKKLDYICKEVLSNPIIETYEILEIAQQQL